jgi:hypothetical protein
VDISLDGLNLATATGVCVLFNVHLPFRKVTVVRKRRHLSLVRLLSGFPCENSTSRVRSFFVKLRGRFVFRPFEREMAGELLTLRKVSAVLTYVASVLT